MAGVDIIVRNNAGDLVTIARYLDRSGWEVVQNAEEGSGGIYTLTLDDFDGSIWDTLGLNVGGRRQIRLVDLTSNRIVQFGYTVKRKIRRRYDRAGSPVGRAWSVDIADPNSIIQRRMMKGRDARRPRETDVERIQWLITTAEWDLVDQFLIATTSPKTMSKADYRGQMVSSILSDCSQQSGKNYWIDLVNTGAGDRLTLWYGKDNVDTYASDLRLSNDLADIDIPAIEARTSTDTYWLSKETEYQMDPSRVYTGVGVQWEKGLVYEHSNTAATQFERWDTVVQAPNIHEKDRARERAQNMLERLSSQGEDVRIETATLVPAEFAHLIRAGMRIPAKITFIPEMEDFIDCRILSRGLSPRGDGRYYWMPLTLEPIGPAELSPSCSLTLSFAQTAGVSEQAATVPGTGSTEPVSFNITPEAGVDGIIVAVTSAMNPNVPTDTDMAGTGAYTTEHSDNSSFGHPTAAHIWRTVSAPTGAVAVTAEYTAGFTPTHPTGKSSWAGIAVSFVTNATAPVQSKGNVDTGMTTVTLDSAPTPGNLLIMSVASRNSGTADTQALSPTDGWTQLGSEHCFTTTQDRVGLYARCVAEGDGDTYGGGMLGAGRSSVVCVSEWEIT